MSELSPKRKSFNNSIIYDAFSKSESALKRYLGRFFYRDEDIEDMAQETFLRAYKYTRQRKIDYPKAYLFRVAKSVAMRELAKKSRQMTDYVEEACRVESDESASAEDEVVADQTLALFCEVLSDLPPRCRRVFLMRKYKAMSHREIAETLDISISAVEQHITNGLKRCKARMDKMENLRAAERAVNSKQGRRDQHES